MFLWAALWNVAGGLLMLAFTRWIFLLDNLVLPDPPVYYYTWIALILVFGIGYYMIHLDMFANRNIVRLGIIGKLAFAATFSLCYAAFPGRIPRLFWIPLAGDLWFVYQFAMFLRFASRAGHPGA
jgi:hypothetical protein